MKKLLILLLFPLTVWGQWSFLIPSDTITLLPTMTTIDSITSGYLSMRPAFSYSSIVWQGAPTAIQVGAFSGFSMPIWNSNSEQLFIKEYIAGRWDGVSDIKLYITCALVSAETAGEDFSFELAWNRKSATTGVLPTTFYMDTVQQELQAGRADQYAIYRLEFTINYDEPDPDLTSGDEFGARIRRVDCTGDHDDVDDEMIVLDIILTYAVDKIFKQ